MVQLHDLHVVLGAELQVALEPRRASAPAPGPRSRAAAAARGRTCAATCFAASDELVDDDLRAVGEVAELRLPQHQRRRVGQAVAVLEAEHAGLRQRAVDDLERAPGPSRDVVERHVFGLGLLVDQHGVAVGEGAAPHVLAGQAHAACPRSAACRRPAPRRSPSRCPRRSRSSARLASSCRAILRLTLKPVGHAWSARVPTSLQRFERRRRCRRGARRREAPARGRPRRLPASRPCSADRSLAASNCVLQLGAGTRSAIALDVLGASARPRRPAARRRAAAWSGACAIVRYISGWVKAGSSLSLWPWRR